LRIKNFLKLFRPFQKLLLIVTNMRLYTFSNIMRWLMFWKIWFLSWNFFNYLINLIVFLRVIYNINSLLNILKFRFSISYCHKIIRICKLILFRRRIKIWNFLLQTLIIRQIQIFHLVIQLSSLDSLNQFSFWNNIMI